jgi:Fe-S-cluster formation regulator IscX/YfhJ
MSQQQHAVTLVRRAIEEYLAPPAAFDPSRVQFVTLADAIVALPEPPGDDDFVRALKRWLKSAVALRDAGFGDGDAWYRVGKPWLLNLVGWNALSDTGRAAGSRGYALLAEAYLAHWDEPLEQGEAQP